MTSRKTFFIALIGALAMSGAAHGQLFTPEIQIMAGEILPEVQGLLGRETQDSVTVSAVPREDLQRAVRRALRTTRPRDEVGLWQSAWSLVGLADPEANLPVQWSRCEEAATAYRRVDQGWELDAEVPRSGVRPVLRRLIAEHLLDLPTEQPAAEEPEEGTEPPAAPHPDAVLAASSVRAGALALLQMKLQPAGDGPLDPLGALRSHLEGCEGLPAPLLRRWYGPVALGAAFYGRGRGLEEAVRRFDGDALEALAADPPRSTEQLLVPNGYYGWRKDERTGLPELEAPSGWEVKLHGGFGALSVGLLTNEPGEDLDPATWLTEPVEGWGDDRWALIEDGEGQRRLLWLSRWEDEDEAAEFLAALRPELAPLAAQRDDAVALVAGAEAEGAAWVQRLLDSVHPPPPPEEEAE